MPAAPARPDGRDYVDGGAPIAAGQPRLTRRTAADRPAFGKQARAGRAVDRPVDAAAAEQRCTCGVDDRIDREAGGGPGDPRRSVILREGTAELQYVCEQSA